MVNLTSKTKLYAVAGFAVGYYIGRHWEFGVDVKFRKAAK